MAVSIETFAKRFSAKMKNISFDMEWNPDVVKRGWKTIFRQKNWSAVRGGIQKAMIEGMSKCSALIYNLYKRRLSNRKNPIMPMVLNVIKSVGEYMVNNPSKFIKIEEPMDAGDGLSINVSMTPFSLTMFEERSRKLRSLYYRRSGYILGSYAKYKQGKPQKRQGRLATLLDQRYDQKSPGLGWLIEFGRNKSGDIMPRNGKIILIWNEAKKGYFVTKKSIYRSAKGVNIISTQKNILRADLKKKFEQILMASLVNVFGKRNK